MPKSRTVKPQRWGEGASWRSALSLVVGISVCVGVAAVLHSCVSGTTDDATHKPSSSGSSRTRESPTSDPAIGTGTNAGAEPTETPTPGPSQAHVAPTKPPETPATFTPSEPSPPELSAEGSAPVVEPDINGVCKEYCAGIGSCSLVNGACKPASNAECQQSANCASLGWCSVDNYECKALTDRDCADSAACREAADCTARNGLCGPPPPSDADCAKEVACTVLGHCSALNGTCGAKTSADCANSAVCTGSGLCTAQAGQCVTGGEPTCPAAGCADAGP